LEWEKRKVSIFNELKNLNSDIICCQEVERDEKLFNEIGGLGYDVSYKPRIGKHSDGSATFWKFDRFELENLYCLELNLDQSKIYCKDNICLFTVLKPKFCEKVYFIVANTHILFNINRGDIKLGQVYQILNSLRLLKDKYSDRNNNQIISFLCGDINSIPNSGTYKLITEGKLDCTNLDYKKKFLVNIIAY